MSAVRTVARRGLPAALLALCAAVAAAPPVSAGTVNCTNIASLPATLTTQGTYCLKQDVSTSVATGTAITIAANNITIDCNGFKVGGLGAGGATMTTGIGTAGDRLNATVRGCAVRGFMIGLDLKGDGHLVEDNRFDSNTTVGMRVAGDASMVRGNRVFSTGLGPHAWPSVGIHAIGSLDVSDNSVSRVVVVQGSNLGAFGIYTQSNLEGVVARNHVRGIQGDAVASSFAIRNDDAGHVSLRDNTVSDDGVGFAAGIFCNGATGVASGNDVLGFEFPISGCLQGNGNTLQ